MDAVTLAEFVRLRHNAWLGKTYGADLEPETVEVFGVYRYTNIWRELDRNTIYLLNNVHVGNLETDLLNTIRFRMFNRVSTREYLVKEFGSYDAAFDDSNALEESLRTRRPNFTAAYSSSYGIRKTCHMLQTDRLLETVTAGAQQLRNGEPWSAWKTMMELPGVSKFTADMFIMDVTPRGGMFEEQGRSFYPDYKRGAARGLEICAETNQGDTGALMEQCREALQDDDTLPRVNGRAVGFDHRELEHAVCEYSKYIRVTRTSGRNWVDLHMRKLDGGISRDDDLQVDVLPRVWTSPLAYVACL